MFDEQEQRLLSEVSKCYQGRYAAKDRLLRPLHGMRFEEQKELGAAMDLARKNYKKALAELKAYRERIAKLRATENCPLTSVMHFSFPAVTD